MQIAHAIQSTDIGTAIRESALVFPVILTTHLACIAVFGGMILVTDLRLLGWALRGRAVADVVDGLRNWKRLGFCIMVTMGALLAGSEAEKYSINPFFWCKMVTLALIGVHALVFRRSVYAKASEFDRTGVIPGRAKLATRPAPTGSTAPANTIGTVRLACRKTAVVAPPEAIITSGASASSSAA